MILFIKGGFMSVHGGPYLSMAFFCEKLLRRLQRDRLRDRRSRYASPAPTRAVPATRATAA